MKFLMIMIILFLIPTPFAYSEDPDIFDSIQIGQTKDEIRKTLGDPYEEKIFEKQTKPIWGPEEEFWDRIPNGTTLEVWRYTSGNGHLNLYFLYPSDRLAYKAFAPRGVVYEPTK